MIQLSLLLLFYFIPSILTGVPSTSRVISEEAEIEVTRCIRPFLNDWESFHSSEAKNSPIVFSMPFLTRSSVLLLCDSYSSIRSSCLIDLINLPRYDSSIPSHVLQNVEFFCGPTAQLILDALPCISGSLLRSRHCLSSLMGLMPSSSHSHKCSSLHQFFICTKDRIESDCGEGSMISFAASLSSFGCPIQDFDDRINQLLQVANSTSELTMNNTNIYIKEELRKMRLDEDDLPLIEGSGYDDPIEGTPIHIDDQDDLSLQTIKEPRSINQSIINQSISSDLSKSIECSVEQEKFLTECYSELADRTSVWISSLPIHVFSFPSAEIRDLCEDYRRTTEKCLGPHFDLNCTGSSTVNTMDMRIGTMCTASLSQSFVEDFQCLKKVTTMQGILQWEKRDMEGKKGCESISSSPITDCASSHEFLCYARRSLIECSPEAFDLFISTLFTLGCNTKALENNGTTDLMTILMSEDLFQSQRTTIIPSSTTESTPNEEFEESLNKETKKEKGKKIIDTELEEGDQIFVEPNTQSTNDIINRIKKPKVFATKNLSGEDESIVDVTTLTPSENSVDTEQRIERIEVIEEVDQCKPQLRNKSRYCMKPLINRWMKLKENRKISNITFVLFSLSSNEILELCDDYANIFLCAGMETIRKCLRDDEIRFFRDHLGYSCSPQNIARFLTHFECLSTQQSKGKCTRYIEGIFAPGQEEDKCVGLLEYRQCLAEDSSKVCGEAALRELNESIRQFGCSRTERF